MRFLLSLSLGGLMLGASALAQAALFEHQSLDLQTEARAAGQEHKQLAVLLALPDCPSCKVMEARVYSKKTIEKSFSRKFRTVRLDMTQQAALIEPGGQTSTPAQFASRLRVVASPSFAFFDAQGQVVYRYTGELDAAGFEQLSAYVSRGDYERRPFVAAHGAPDAAEGQSTGSHAAHAAHAH